MDIYCLQDTHFTKNDKFFIRNQSGSDCIFSSYKSNARGVAILFGKKIDYKIHKQISDETGNYIILDISVNNQRFTLVTLYGPNSDNTAFYEIIFKHIDEIGNLDFTICGDYNLVLDPNMDSYNYKACK